MATLTEVLGQRDTQQGDAVAGLNQSMSTAVNLATAKEQIEGRKVALEQQKEQLEVVKYNKALNSLSTLARTRPDIAKRMVPKVQENLMKAGIPVDPNVLEVMASDEEKKRLYMASYDYLSGQANTPEARTAGLQALNDYGAFDKGLEAIFLQNKQAGQMEVAELRAKVAESRADAANARFNEKQSTQKEMNIAEAKQKTKDKFDAAIKGDYEAFGQAAKAEALLASGGPIADEAAKSSIARMFEKGVLTDQDVSRLSGGQGLLTRGQQLVDKLISGDLSEENRAELYRITKTLRPVLAEKIKSRADRDAKAASKIYGIPKEQFLDVITPEELLAEGPVAPAGQNQQAQTVMQIIEKKTGKKVTPEMAAQIIEKVKMRAGK